ncbi:MAG: hypothetical protein ACRDVP_11425 [Acidimicrobiales bacterium]
MGSSVGAALQRRWIALVGLVLVLLGGLLPSPGLVEVALLVIGCMLMVFCSSISKAAMDWYRRQLSGPGSK